MKKHSTFMPHESILKEIENIIYYSFYKWAHSKRGPDEGCGPNEILQIWPNRRVKRRIISGDEVSTSYEKPYFKISILNKNCTF